MTARAALTACHLANPAANWQRPSPESYRPGKYGTSMRCGIPGRKPIRPDVGWAGRKDFGEVEQALARSGAFTHPEPPGTSAASA